MFPAVWDPPLFINVNSFGLTTEMYLEDGLECRLYIAIPPFSTIAKLPSSQRSLSFFFFFFFFGWGGVVAVNLHQTLQVVWPQAEILSSYLSWPDRSCHRQPRRVSTNPSYCGKGGAGFRGASNAGPSAWKSARCTSRPRQAWTFSSNSTL